jgi:hypothetical protein
MQFPEHVCAPPWLLIMTHVTLWWVFSPAQCLRSCTAALLQVAAYLGLKLFVLPWLMLGITHMMGIAGRPAVALLLLTAVPVSAVHKPKEALQQFTDHSAAASCSQMSS